MSTKRHVLIVTVAACAAALAAPLPLADGSTADEPVPSGTIVYVDPGPPTSVETPDDVEQVEAPLQATDTTEPATEDVAEEPEPEPEQSASTPKQTVFPHPLCGGYLVKGDDIPPPQDGDEDIVDEPDPEAGATTTGDDTSGDDLTDAADGGTDEPAADDDTPGDGAEADVLGGEESPPTSKRA